MSRHERLAAVHAALDGGRYVEVRGDAGVGKSASPASRAGGRTSRSRAPRSTWLSSWWRTADGKLDGDRRERARLLKALAQQALSRAEPLDVSDRPARAVDALVRSETLRDLGGDRVAFRHDVFREWAIANLLSSEPSAIDRLPLDRPAPATLARGVELTARIALERDPDAARWQSLLEVLSREGAHGSWRRAVLLAFVRSEVGLELLKCASGLLLADRASLLRELMRTLMAVEVEPASKMFATAGLNVESIPASFNIPNGPSWIRLISWLLSLGKRLPAAAIPDVVNFYTAWSIGMIGFDLLTPKLLKWLYRWLSEIETDHETGRDLREPFGGGLDYDQIGPLESDLRAGFLLYCHRTPSLAAEYLRSLKQRRYGDNAVRSILKFRGSLAQAAPAELAELAAAALIPKRQPDEGYHRRELEEPFDFLDHEFLPASPAQGPFFELLTHAPEHGLSLVRRLVDHAISFYSNGRSYGSDAIGIQFPGGERVFPWVRSYAWSRQEAGHYCVTSALMALEAWAHIRIEAGEPFDTVLADVLGPPDTPAAYLLVAVDLLLSHWPKSREAAAPFLASPELLCLDRERQILDNFEVPDFFGFSTLQKEPVGQANIESLKQRPSRRTTLEQVIGQYAIFGPAKLRGTLTELMHLAITRLGNPEDESDLGDPAFMAVHALNLADPSNWQEVSMELTDGTQTTVHQYVPPQAESQHLQALQEASKDQITDANLQSALNLALEDRSRSSPKLAAAGVAWAQRAAASSKSSEADKDRMREQAILAAAMIAVRDGSAELRAQHEPWVRSVLARALRTKNDPVHRVRSGVRFNPIAIAFVGLIHLLRDRAETEDVRAVLEVAARDNPAAAHGFGAAATALAAIDERLPRAVLRCAFAARVQPRREWDLSEEEVEAYANQHRNRIGMAVDAELTWLAGERREPDWPSFPAKPARPRRGLRLPGGPAREEPPAPETVRADERVDHQGARKRKRSELGPRLPTG